MAVVIANRNKPDSCCNCRLTAEGRFGTPLCPFYGSIGWDQDTQAQTYSRCPLIQLPQAYGRLIDADKLKQHYAWWGENSEQKKLFDQIIDRQPTVVEATG